MNNTDKKKIDSEASNFRDELNFAEFPLASLSDRLPDDLKTIHFKDIIYDKNSKKHINRILTISASDEYGLPTALDEEVILGLIQLTNQNQFRDKKVKFTRYELIKLLGWSDDLKSYERLENSLKRWLGVTLYYDKAWWSKEDSCWVSENFHILDQVTILDRERRDSRVKKGAGDPEAGKSSFVWNDVVFNSFQSGYLKKIDMNFYRNLDSSISKRIYRFLDKRFYMKSNLEFDLHDFAFEHIGLSRNYHTGEIKRKLDPALNELTESGFLKKLSSEERYIRQCRGQWTIVLVKNDKLLFHQSTQEKQEEGLHYELITRGISKSTALILIEKFQEEKIREKIELYDYLVNNKDKRISTNPAGYLYKSITEDYSLPKGFETKVQKEERLKLETVKKKKIEDKKKLTQKIEVKKELSRRELLDAFWVALNDNEKTDFEKEALELADKFLFRQYVDGKVEGGTLFKTVRQAIIDSHIERKIGGGVF